MELLTNLVAVIQLSGDEIFIDRARLLGIIRIIGNENSRTLLTIKIAPPGRVRLVEIQVLMQHFLFER